MVSYRFEEERGPGRPPKTGPLVKGAPLRLRCARLLAGLQGVARPCRALVGSARAQCCLLPSRPPLLNTPAPPRPPRHTFLQPPTEGECEEVYGAEHVLALGSTEREWEMFTDGYDPESGER